MHVIYFNASLHFDSELIFHKSKRENESQTTWHNICLLPIFCLDFFAQKQWNVSSAIKNLSEAQMLFRTVLFPPRVPDRSEAKPAALANLCSVPAAAFWASYLKNHLKKTPY